MRYILIVLATLILISLIPTEETPFLEYGKSEKTFLSSKNSATLMPYTEEEPFKATETEIPSIKMTVGALYWCATPEGGITPATATFIGSYCEIFGNSACLDGKEIVCCKKSCDVYAMSCSDGTFLGNHSFCSFTSSHYPNGESCGDN